MHVPRTTDEANAFLQEHCMDDVFSSQLKTVAAIRTREKKKGKLNAVDRQALWNIYAGTATVADRSDNNLFRKEVPEKAIQAWFDHVADILQLKINDAHWIKTGTLLYHDELLLFSFAALVQQPVPAVMTFENNRILEIITSMIISRKGESNRPSASFADGITMIIHGLFTCGTESFDNPWKPYNVFKKLKAAGILEQFIRCAAIQSAVKHTSEKKRLVLHGLLSCTDFVRKRLKPGSPCGETLRFTIDRTGGPPAGCSCALPFLQSLVKLSTFLQIADCQHCKKFDQWENYMRCGDCKSAVYCSKECQRADWTKHKPTCRAISNGAAKRIPRQVPNSVIWGMLKDIYVPIMIRFVEECDKAGGFGLENMILEIRFVPDMNGKIPFLQDPPEFQIVPSARYVDGSRLREIENSPGATTIQENFDKEMSDNPPYKIPECIQIFEYHPHSTLKKTLQLFTDANEPMLTQGALDAFRIALVDNDYSHLYNIFKSQELVESYSNQIRMLKSSRAGADVGN